MLKLRWGATGAMVMIWTVGGCAESTGPEGTGGVFGSGGVVGAPGPGAGATSPGTGAVPGTGGFATGGADTGGAATGGASTGGTGGMVTTGGTGGMVATGGTGGSTGGTGGSTGGTGGSTGGTGGSTGGTGGTGGSMYDGADFVIDAYGVSGTYKGYTFGAAEVGSTITPEAFTGNDLCVSGSVAPDPAYGGWAMLGWNINQEKDAMGTGLTPMNIAPEGTGIAYDVSNYNGNELRIQIQTADEGASGRWCATISTAKGDATGIVKWNQFNTACWDNSGDTYNGSTPIGQVSVLVPGGNKTAVPFDFCVTSLGPS